MHHQRSLEKPSRAGAGHRQSRGRRAPLRALCALALAGLVSPTLPSCSSEDASGAAPCEATEQAFCGATCADDTKCGEGLYCDASGACTADCAAGGAQCGSGYSCSDRGRCVKDPDDFTENGDPSTNPAGGGGDPNGSCADINVTFDRVIPTVMLLIDQSGSMDQRFGDGTRWDVLRSALMDGSTGLVKVLENDVRFGLALYTSHNGNAGGVCPVLSEVSTALGNYDEINAVFAGASPDDDTPTAESITAVAGELALVDEPGPKVIVLATDGEPDSCENPDDQRATALSVAAAEAAFAEGLKTFVISVGNDVSEAHLQDMANAGAGVQPGDPAATFYRALDQQSLIDAFATIISGVRTCVFTLNGTVTEAGAGSVLLDGEKLTLDDPNGWKLNSPSEIELTGDACTTIQDGQHNLSVTFPCGTVDDIK